MNEYQISRLVLEGFKSIKKCDLELTDINILIGPNGAGKSNFISFFQLIQQMLEGNLQLYVSKQGGPDALLQFGRKKTEEIKAEIYFGENGYKFTLIPTQDNRLIFAKECFWWNKSGDWDKGFDTGHSESQVEEQKSKTKIYNFTVPAMKRWRLYHFHDTSETAQVKQIHNINDNSYLRNDARNLAAFLYLLKEQYSNNYDLIVKTIQLVAPFFSNFNLRPKPNNQETIELEWTEKGEDIPFKAHHLSDGTLRFICLATVLLQPEELQPETIIFDEPELGLHPYAINILAGMFRSTSKVKQIIVSTQSVELLSEFEPENVIVSDRIDGSSYLHRLDGKSLETWLEEYTLGELWKKNLIGGRPSR